MKSSETNATHTLKHLRKEKRLFLQGDLILKSDYVIEMATKIAMAGNMENLVTVCQDS